MAHQFYSRFFLGIILLSYAGDHAQHQIVQSDRILGVFLAYSLA